MGIVKAAGDGYDVLVCSLKLWEPLDGLGYGAGVELVRKNDRTFGRVCAVGGAVDKGLIVAVDERHGLIASRDHLPVIRILIPKDGRQVQLLGDCAYAVVNVTKGRTPAEGGDAEDVGDGLAGIVELAKDLLVGEGGHVGVRPGMHANFMAISETTLGFFRPVSNVAANVEQGNLLIILFQKIVQLGISAVWTIVISQSQRVWLRTHRDVGFKARGLWSDAGLVSPPTIWIGGRIIRRDKIA